MQYSDLIYFSSSSWYKHFHQVPGDGIGNSVVSNLIVSINLEVAPNPHSAYCGTAVKLKWRIIFPQQAIELTTRISVTCRTLSGQNGLKGSAKEINNPLSLFLLSIHFVISDASCLLSLAFIFMDEQKVYWAWEKYLCVQSNQPHNTILTQIYHVPLFTHHIVLFFWLDKMRYALMPHTALPLLRWMMTETVLFSCSNSGPQRFVGIWRFALLIHILSRIKPMRLETLSCLLCVLWAHYKISLPPTN